MEMDGYTSSHRLRNAHIPEEAKGVILRAPLLSVGLLICFRQMYYEVSSSLGKYDCFSETFISLTVSKPSLHTTLEFRTHRILVLKRLFKNKNQNTKSFTLSSLLK